MANGISLCDGIQGSNLKKKKKVIFSIMLHGTNLTRQTIKPLKRVLLFGNSGMNLKRLSQGPVSIPGGPACQHKLTEEEYRAAEGEAAA